MAGRLFRTLRQALQRWPWFLLMLVVGLIQDRFDSRANDFIDEHAYWGLEAARVAIDLLPYALWLVVLPATLAIVIAHAYIESRLPARLVRLADECIATSQEILQYLGERHPTPTMPSRSDWDQGQQEYLQAFQRMMSDFDTQFGSRVVRLHDELKQEGIEDQRLERAYEHPTNTFGIRDIGFALGALGEQLRTAY